MSALQTPSVLDYLEFSELAYDLTDGSGPSVPLPAGFAPLQIEANQFGVNAVAFIDPATQQIVIAYRGTETSSPYDLAQDVQLALGHRPPVFDQAEQFASSLVNDPTYVGYTFTVTGHSLGAAEAEDVAAALQLGGVVFAPPGVSSELGPGISPTDAQPLTAYVNRGDPIGMYASDTVGVPTPNGSHVGTVDMLMPDYHLGHLILALDAVGAPVTNVLDVLIVAVLSEHFLPLYALGLNEAGVIPSNPLPLKPGAFLRLVQGYENFLAVLGQGNAGGPAIDDGIGFADSRPVAAAGPVAGRVPPRLAGGFPVAALDHNAAPLTGLIHPAVDFRA